MSRFQHARHPQGRARSSFASNRAAANPEDPRRVVQRAQVAPQTLTPGDVGVLQRSIGNRATTHLLRPLLQKQDLTLGPADDHYEQEADRVAAQVVSSRPLGDSPVSAVQRMDAAPKAPTPIKITAFSDMLRASTASFGQRSMHGPEGGEVESSVAQSIQSARGGGRPLDEGVRRSMEQRFGVDFSSVRIHTGQQADTLNRSLNAKAFTTGNDIFFRERQYQPGSASGKQLLAHELTHTVQQGATGQVQAQRDMIQRDGEGELTLAAVLSDRVVSKIFYEFCKAEYSAENYDFWSAVMSYKKKPRRSVAITIYDKFIQQDSPTAINASSEALNGPTATIERYRREKENQSLINKIGRKFARGQKGDPNLFDSALDAVLANMNDTFRRFQLSEVGGRALEYLNRRARRDRQVNEAIDQIVL